MTVLLDAAHDHLGAAAIASTNIALAFTGVLARVFGAEVPDGLLVGGVLFVLGTGSGIIGWSLVVLVKLSTEVAALQTAREDIERRLEGGGL